MSALTAQISIWGVPGDIAALLFLFISLLAFGLTGGQRFSVAFLIGLYVATTIVVVLPSLRGFLLRFSVVLPASTNAVAFFVATAFATWLLAGNTLGGLFRLEKRGLAAWWQVSIASVLGTGLFATLFFPMLPKETWIPSNLLSTWFLADPMPFLWVLAPVLFFVILRTDN